MARRKSKKSKLAKEEARPEPAKWSDEDRLQLLAYSNWCASHNINFLATVMNYLKRVTGNEFSEQQIRGKLRREWNIYGYHGTNSGDWFLQGTTALQLMEHDEQNIQQRLVQMNPPDIQYRLRGVSSARSSQPRALSRGFSVPNTPESGNRRPARSHVPKPRPSKEQMASLSSHSSNDVGDDRLSEGRVVHRVKGEEQPRPNSIPLSGNQGSELLTSDAMMGNKDGELFPGQRPVDILHPTTELQRLQTEAMRHKASIFSLKGRLAQVEQELNDLKRYSQADNADPSSLRQQICHLRRQVEAKDRLWQHTTALEANRLGLSESETIMEYNLLYRNINDICSAICDMISDEALPELDNNHGDTINAWSFKVSDWKLDGLLSHSNIEHVPKHELLPCLVAAGIFSLVFEPTLPDFLALDSPLVHHYRRQILVKDGTQALSQMDHIALKTFTSDDYLKAEVIPERAQSLAEDILGVLWFFFPPTSQEIGRRPPQNDNEATIVNGLATTICRAMELKSNLLLSIFRFNFFFFKPGCLFDPNSMMLSAHSSQIPENYARGRGSQSKMMRSQHCIKLCLVPALYRLPMLNEDDTRSDSELHTALSYNSLYMCVGEAAAEDLQSLVLVAKAVVMV